MKFVQEQGLDVISEGLDTLKNLAQDMNEVGHFAYNICNDVKIVLIDHLLCHDQEIERQVPLMAEIDTKVRSL